MLLVSILVCSHILSFSQIVTTQVPQIQERIDSTYFYFNGQSKRIRHCYLWKYDEIAMRWKVDKSSNELTYLQSFFCNYEGQRYFVLLWAYRNGRYKWELIQEGWYTWPEYFCLIFTETEWAEYNRIDSVPEIRLDAIYSTEEITYFGHDYDVNDFVHRAIVKKQKKQANHSLFISKTKDGKIRFARVKLDNSNRYFETSVEQFNSLMIPYPDDENQIRVKVNPGESDFSTRTILAIGSSVLGILIGVFVGVFV